MSSYQPIRPNGQVGRPGYRFNTLAGAYNGPQRVGYTWQFVAPLNDAGNGAVNTTPDLAAATTTSFTRATASTARLSTGRLKTDVASGVARALYAMAGGYLGYFYEIADTNLCIRSEAFDDVAWTKTDTTVTANNTTAPDGTLTADLLTEGVAGTAGTLSSNGTVADAATVSDGVYLKPSSATWVRVRLTNSASTNGGQAWFNLQTGVIGTVQNVGSGTATTGLMELDSDGFYRCQITTTLASGDVTARLTVMSANADASNTRVNNAAYWAWGAHISQAAWLMSYIPTAGTAVTRNADNLAYTGAPDFGAQGSMAVTATVLRNPAPVTSGIVAVSDSTTSERVVFQHVVASSNPSLTVTDGGANQCNIGVSGWVAGTPIKLAASWETNRMNFAMGGTLGTEDTNGTMPTTNAIRLTGGGTAAQFNGCAKELKVSSRPRPRTNLASITI